MDLVIFGLLNIAILIAGFWLIGRRIQRQFGSQAFLSKVEQEANNIITELNATTERNIRILEETITNLEQVISAAEISHKKLTSALPPPSPIAAKPVAPAVRVEIVPPISHPAVSHPVLSQPVFTPPTLPAAAPAVTEAEDSGAMIRRLARQGFESEIIAQRVGRTVGEVELIIKLSGDS